MWIVSDKDGTKWLCETKPTREKNSWSDKGKCIMLRSEEHTSELQSQR